MDETFLVNSDGLAVEETIKFIEKHRNSPFFINLWLRAPHTPLVATEEQRKPYEHVPEPKQTYYSVLTEADKQIGKLLNKLDELGLRENTMVIFSSDNGPETANPKSPGTQYCQGSTGGLRGRKRSLYEGGIRVPFIVRWPGMTPENRIDFDSLLSSVDLLPTFCQLAGVELPHDLHSDGVNMTDALLGRTFDREKPLMWEWRPANQAVDSKDSPIYAVRQGKYVLLKNPSDNRIELYDVYRDHAQLYNMASENSVKVEEMSQILEDWLQTLPTNSGNVK